MSAGTFVLGRKLGTAAEFVEFWEQLYAYPNENLYTDNIGKPLTPSLILKLYKWKNGGKLSTAKWESVERNYTSRVEEARALPEDTPAEEFLERFSEGGAIWRIYWLHLWKPQKYPIYDQHVHRAMELIERRRSRETPTYDPAKVSSYLERFLPFVREHFRGFDQRRVDRALWACGKYMKALSTTEVPTCA